MPSEFVDRFGVRHPLDPALRDHLKPAWRTMLDAVASSAPPTDDAILDRVRKAKQTMADVVSLLGAAGGARLSGRCLEVGCYDGAVAFELSKLDGVEAVASDMARYYVVQRPGEPADVEVARQQDALYTLRERTRQASDAPPGAVEFLEDDITASSLPDGSFDAILSFEVLEHLADPRAAFAAMRRLLKPGGIGYHEYNSFFSVNGGHSLCTLDFPWGHVRLDASDFERYLAELRPDAAAQTLRFYRESLNRMTQADLRDAIASAGLEEIAVLPWPDRSLVGSVSAAVLDEVRRAYPRATLHDLLSTFVVVVVRRPS
jgi:SAM-dependent methyltransferase